MTRKELAQKNAALADTSTLPDVLIGKTWRAVELAAQMHVSPKFVRDRVRDEQGVTSMPQLNRGNKRVYTTLLIPDAVARRVFGTMLRLS